MEHRRTTTKWGFGMAPLKNTTRTRYDHAVDTVLRFLQEAISPDNIDLDAFSDLKGMFNRSLRKDQWDWFTVYEQLGHPPRKEMHDFVEMIIELRKSLRDSELSSIIHLRDNLKRSTIIHYLTCWQSIDNNVGDGKSGWLYILSTKAQPDILKIGMTTRTVTQRVNEINRATGVLYPYSPRSVYRVKNAGKAEREVFMLLSDYRIRRDREFFEISFHEAAKIIENSLSSEHMLIRYQGTIKWFDAIKGYGFVQTTEGRDIFVHIDDIIDEFRLFLTQDQIVEFDIENTDKGPKAVNIIFTKMD